MQLPPYQIQQARKNYATIINRMMNTNTGNQQEQRIMSQNDGWNRERFGLGLCKPRQCEEYTERNMNRCFEPFKTYSVPQTKKRHAFSPSSTAHVFETIKSHFKRIFSPRSWKKEEEIPWAIAVNFSKEMTALFSLIRPCESEQGMEGIAEPTSLKAKFSRSRNSNFSVGRNRACSWYYCSRRTRASRTHSSLLPKKMEEIEIQPMDIKVKKQTLSCLHSQKQHPQWKKPLRVCDSPHRWAWPWAEQEKGSSWFHQNNTLRNQNFPEQKPSSWSPALHAARNIYPRGKTWGQLKWSILHNIFHVPCEIIEFERGYSRRHATWNGSTCNATEQAEHKSEEHQIPIASKVRMIRKGYVNEPLLDYHWTVFRFQAIFLQGTRWLF